MTDSENLAREPIPIPKGLYDILPVEQEGALSWRNVHYWQYVEEMIRKTVAHYGYREIRTPMFERTELFARGVGEASDIVTKEMYTFIDKGGRSMTLRPEGTAPVMRSFVEKRLDTLAPVHKLFYMGPMFRYERPQAGRYRQFHHFGAEAIGVRSAEQDVELIDMIYTLYSRLGIKGLSLYLNTVGDVESRKNYRNALQSYLRPHLSDLSADSKKRFEENPLRILDSKDRNDRAIVAEAPSIHDYLTERCMEHFSSVRSYLERLKIPFHIEPKLVRGLDYYTDTVFEFVAGELGAQDTVGAGGRFDSLIRDLGGPNLPGVGFATGIERVIQTMVAQGIPFPARPVVDFFLIPLGERARGVCFEILCSLRREGIPSDMDLTGKKLKVVMKHADRAGVKHVVVVGDNEIEAGKVEVQEMATGKKRAVDLADIIQSILKGKND
ncbi:histidine--tRNA ligase [Simkania negevensis]|uniref:Histidine--tRNA ligase n=1 Tax=Simkania negevensis TaxID=83561 RepID=A0ABS3ASQ6_9BACT|nr:histidine--tRNA ligase [Simkania negevensis]